VAVSPVTMQPSIEDRITTCHARNSFRPVSGQVTKYCGEEQSWVKKKSCADDDEEKLNLFGGGISAGWKTIVCPMVKIIMFGSMDGKSVRGRPQKVALRVGPEHLLSPIFPLSVYFLILYLFLLSPFLIGFNYFLLLSISFLSTRIVPLRFQVGGRRKRPNQGLVCCV